MADLVTALALSLSLQSQVFEPIEPTPDPDGQADSRHLAKPINASWAEGIEDAEIFALP